MHVVPPAEHQSLTNRHPQFDPSNRSTAPTAFFFCSHTYLFRPGFSRRYDSTRYIGQQPVLAATSRTLFFFPRWSDYAATPSSWSLLFSLFFSRLREFEQCYVLFLCDLTGRKEWTISLSIPTRAGSGHYFYFSLSLLLTAFSFLTR